MYAEVVFSARQMHVTLSTPTRAYFWSNESQSELITHICSFLLPVKDETSESLGLLEPPYQDTIKMHAQPNEHLIAARKHVVDMYRRI